MTNGSYNATTGVVTFNTFALAAGASTLSSFSLVVQGSPSSITVTANSSSASIPDQDLTNNSASIATTITRTGLAGIAAACATPGQDLSPTISTNPNAYYPAANQTLAVNATSIAVGQLRERPLTSSPATCCSLFRCRAPTLMQPIPTRTATASLVVAALVT
ncbi:hypothetical protein GKZ67_00765 [Hymenobacter sp. BRD67]|nr:hypothetical protein GKZ67_00765 [Hymenobacter sp. BRD67]